MTVLLLAQEVPRTAYLKVVGRDAKTRAGRRQAEMPDADKRQDIGQVRRNIEARDKSDQDRKIGPLRPAEDAIIVDTTELTIEEVVQTLLEYVEDRC